MFHRSTLIFTTFVLTLILSPPAVQAQVEQVNLRVDGLACPFCAYGLEKKVSKLEGYKTDSYKVRINEGVVSFGWRNDEPLDLDAVEKAVDKAGFTLRGVTGRFVGTLEKEKDQYLLRLLAPFVQQFVLQEASDAGQGHVQVSQTLSNRMEERLESLMADGNAVEIVGRVHRRGDAHGLDGMEVSDLKVLEPPVESVNRFVFEVKELRCGGCVTRVVQAVGSLEGVLHVEGDYEADRVVIWTGSKSPPDLTALEEKIATLGFDVRPLSTTEERSTRGTGG